MSTDRRVLHVITGLDVGGAENMLATLLEARRPNAPKASVVSLTPAGPLAARITHAGAPVADLGIAGAATILPGLWKLAGQIRVWKPHAIQGWMYHGNLAATLALGLSGRRRGTGLYWGIRCSDMDLSRYDWQLRLIVRAGARLSHLPDAIVANSEAGRATHERLGYRPQRFQVIDNGIDTERFRPDPRARAELRASLGLAEGTPLLIHVARRDPMKDHETMLASLDRLPGTALLAVGLGTETLPERAGLHRLGRRDDVARVLAAADVVVSSSAFGEGFPSAIAEGMAAGLPAVATDVGDSARIIGETGRVVPASDPVAMSAAIIGLLTEGPDSLAKRGIAARRRIEENFSVARAAAAFDTLHRGLT